MQPSLNKLFLEYGIKNYTINKDLTIDVDGNVDLRNLNITEIPLNFNKVMGKFCIVNMDTTSRPIEECALEIEKEISKKR